MNVGEFVERREVVKEPLRVDKLPSAFLSSIFASTCTVTFW